MLTSRLKELRKSKKLTQSQFADLMGVSQATITFWENGKREPDLATIVKIADVFDTTTDYLLGRQNAKVTIIDGPAPVEPPKGTKRIVVDAQPKMGGAEQAEHPKTIQETIASLIDEALKKRGL